METNAPRGIVTWKPDMEYIGVRIPDKMKIASLINEAKGKGIDIYMDYVEAELKNELHGEAIDFRMEKPL